jgi:hypothetical protein
VERGLVRRGLKVWRFNDDFRILCQSYQETLASEARNVGLMINDHKTFTPGMWKYIGKYTNLGVAPGLQQIDPLDVEVAVAPYADFWGAEGAAMAMATLARLNEDYGGPDPHPTHRRPW